MYIYIHIPEVYWGTISSLFTASHFETWTFLIWPRNPHPQQEDKKDFPPFLFRNLVAPREK